MAGAMKKDVVCDYCQIEKEPSLIYTTRKVFAGRKIIDLLQIITQRNLPVSIGIKICNVCASSLMSTSAIIEKTQQLIEKSLQTQKSKTTSDQNKKEKEPNKDVPLEVIDLNVNTVNKDHLEKKKPETKKQAKVDVPVSRSSPRKSAQGTTLVNQVSPRKQSADVDIADAAASSSPKKFALATPKLATPTNKVLAKFDIEDEFLVDAVNVTPSNATVKKQNSIIQLFGASETIDDYLSENEEHNPINAAGDASTKIGTIKINANNFDCKLCDFVSKTAKPLKDHLKSVHNQQRPRIFYCSACSKTFGVLKTLKQHLLTHGIITPKPEPKKKKKIDPKPTKAQTTLVQPELAVFTALNEPVDKPKPAERNINSDYTFQVNGESASTPKPIDSRRESMNFQCDVCDSEVQTVKLMQEHMKTTHQVEKPKIFKCITCNKNLGTKQSLELHVEKYHKLDSADTLQKPTKFQIPETEIAQSKNSTIKDKSKKLMEDETEGEIVKLSKKKVESSPKKESKVINDSSIKESKSNPENVIDLNNTEISLLSNDEESLNVTVKKSPLKKHKSKPEKIIAFEKFTENTLPLNGEETPNKNVKRKLDSTKLNDGELKLAKKSKKPKNNSITDATIQDIDENLDEINHQVKPHKKIRLESIVYSETDEGEFSCNQCGKSVGSRKRLDSHIQKKHAKSLLCPTCSSVYSCHLKYVKHFADCDRSNGLPCGIKKCKKIFQDDDYLISHLEKKHDWS